MGPNVSSQVREVRYFGYGANRSAEMMEAIIGRRPKGFPAKLSGFQLCIQTFGDLPSSVQFQLSPKWGEGFKSYVARPSGDNLSTILGIIWTITPEERKRIDKWELAGPWYKIICLTVGSVQTEIQVVEGLPIAKVANGLRYKTFLNEKEKMFEVARVVSQN